MNRCTMRPSACRRDDSEHLEVIGHLIYWRRRRAKRIVENTSTDGRSTIKSLYFVVPIRNRRMNPICACRWNRCRSRTALRGGNSSRREIRSARTNARAREAFQTVSTEILAGGSHALIGKRANGFNSRREGGCWKTASRSRRPTSAFDPNRTHGSL